MTNEIINIVSIGVFFSINIFVGVRVSKREKISLLLLLVGVKRDIKFTQTEKALLFIAFSVPLLLMFLANSLLVGWGDGGTPTKQFQGVSQLDIKKFSL